MPIRSTRRAADAPDPRIRWVRARDTATGHEFDLSVKAPVRPGVEIIDGYPANRTPRPRPAKPLADKAGNPTSPAPRPADNGRTTQ